MPIKLARCLGNPVIENVANRISTVMKLHTN